MSLTGHGRFEPVYPDHSYFKQKCLKLF